MYDTLCADNGGMTMSKRYIIEVRDADGKLDFEAEKQKKIEHPYLFSKPTFSIDQLCYYMSYGQERDNPSGPLDLPAFMESIGISYREKYW
jgi:hypothetical protein